MTLPSLCIYQRMALALSVVFMLILGVFVFTSSFMQAHLTKQAEQTLHVQLAEYLVNENPLLQEGVTDYNALANLFHSQMLLGPSFEFYFLDPNGAVLTYSETLGEVVEKNVSIAPIRAFLSEHARFPIFGDDPLQRNGQKIFSTFPVMNNSELQGYLYIIIGGQEYESAWAQLKTDKMLLQFMMALGFAVIFLLIVLLVLFKNLTQPLKSLSEDMDKFRHGQYNLGLANVKLKPWSAHSQNEVHRLGNSFNLMVQHIQSQMQQLHQVDADRRQLLSDLSHDLRTPLANLQGYMETLKLQQHQLSEQQRSAFIDISLKNMLNLQRLVDQIFALAYLESGSVKLELETFPIAELVHDVVAKFAIQAEQKHIYLVVDIADEADFVFSDIEKLERILSNIISNALRHTPENGTVTISTQSDGASVIIAVTDTGVGMSCESQKHIFTPRYQADNQVQDDQVHFGLGLAICQKLLGYLHSELNVRSELGHGACFQFSLQRQQLETVT
jgi:signal transduction histidine kinase